MNIFKSIARLFGSKSEPVFEPPVRTKSDRDAVLANPERYTRASRRAAGYLKPVWVDLMRAMAGHNTLPRYVKRHSTALTSVPTTRRQRKARARSIAMLARRGMVVA